MSSANRHGVNQSRQLDSYSFKELFGGANFPADPLGETLKALVQIASLSIGVPTGLFFLSMAYPDLPSIGLWIENMPGWYLEPKEASLHLISRNICDLGRQYVPAYEYDVYPTKQHLVTITLPGNQVFNFTVAADPATAFYQPQDYGQIVIKPRPGTHATLKPANIDTNVYFNVGPDLSSSGGGVTYNNVELDGLNTDILDDTEYLLTLHDGTVYHISKASGLMSVTDRSGNVVSFNSGTISSSVGSQGVDITRDALGRVTSIINHANANASLKYTYDSQGNLASFTDRIGNTSTYDYNFTHGLTAIHDPRGIMPVQNVYDLQGRLQYTIDAKGNRVSYNYDQSLDPGSPSLGLQYLTSVPTNTQVTVDQLGVPTMMTYDSFGNVTDVQKPLLKQDGSLDHWIRTTNRYSDPANPDKVTAVFTPRNQPSPQYPAGHPALYTYDSNGDLLTATDPLGNKDVFSYDAYGHLLTQTDSLQHVVLTNTYDGEGNLISRSDGRGNVTTYTRSYLRDLIKTAIFRITVAD